MVIPNKLSKAFESVKHEILLNKVYDMRIDTFLFKDYLTNRTQSVRIGNNISTNLQVPFSVPQESILGPILFTMFVNDLASQVNNCLLIQYADDTQFIISGSIENLAELIRKTEHSK